MTKKSELTKVEAFEQALEILKIAEAEDALIEKLEAMKLQEEKTREKAKERAKKAESKAAKANKQEAVAVVKFFDEEADPEVAYDTQEIQDAVGFEYTPQRMKAILEFVENAERVDKATKNKKRVGYVKKA